eukprot:gene12183-5770_t
MGRTKETVDYTKCWSVKIKYSDPEIEKRKDLVVPNWDYFIARLVPKIKEELPKEWRHYEKTEGCSENIVKKYRGYVNLFIKWMVSQDHVEKSRMKLIDDYCIDKTKVISSNIRGHVSAIQHFFILNGRNFMTEESDDLDRLSKALESNTRRKRAHENAFIRKASTITSDQFYDFYISNGDFKNLFTPVKKELDESYTLRYYHAVLIGMFYGLNISSIACITLDAFSLVETPKIQIRQERALWSVKKNKKLVDLYLDIQKLEDLKSAVCYISE